MINDDDTSSPSPAPVSAPPPAAVSVFAALRRMMLTLALLAVLWLAYVYAVPRFLLPRAAPTAESAGQPQTGETPAPKAQAPAEAAAVSRLETLEARLKTLEEVLTALPKDDPAGQAANEKIGILETRIDALQQQNHAETVDSERLARLEARLDDLQSALTSMKEQLAQAQVTFDRQISARAALRQLRETVERGEPFSTPLAHMRLLAEPYPRAAGLLDQLSAQAATGVATLAMLQEQFEMAIPLALAPNADSFGGKLQSLVLVRKVGEDQPGNDAQAIIARAEARLARGDVEGCVDELSRLPRPSARRMAAWVEHARAMLAVRQQLDALELALNDSEPSQPAAKAPAQAAEPAPADQNAAEQP